MKKNIFFVCIVLLTQVPVIAQVVPQGYLVNPSNGTVTIGTQVWMKKNLDVIVYQNGQVIERADLSFNNNIVTPSWCYYNHNSNFNNTYGKLYNGYAIRDARNICPVGFRVPTNADFTTLLNYIGGTDFGFRLKEAGNSHWTPPNAGSEDLYGFTALPGGYMGDQNSSNNMFGFGYFWTSTPIPGGATNYLYYLSYNYGGIRLATTFVLEGGASVRCIRNY